MNNNLHIENKLVFEKMRQLSNRNKFRIIELTQKDEMAITLIAREIRLAYNKCSDYCTKLQRIGLIEKRKQGKEVLVKSKIDVGILSNALKIKT
ncbi:MAG: winged helix-turn-helix domain-containing protein [Nanoarchaeota archaeon]